MLNEHHTSLAKTIASRYRKHAGLFWRIITPLALLAFLLDVGFYSRVVTTLEEAITEEGSTKSVVTSNVNTLSGIHPTITTTAPHRASTSAYWNLFPRPAYVETDTDGSTWRWEPHFRHIDYTPYILLLITLCPLSLAAARITRTDEQHDTPLTAREIWRAVAPKTFRILGAAVIFIFIMDAATYLYGLISNWISPPIEPTFTLLTLYQTYVLVTLSLYAPCLALEDIKLPHLFQRSHALVCGARLRFWAIYLVTAWGAAVLTAVLFGATLLWLSLFTPELATVQEALSPIRVLSLFLGGNIEIVLPNLLNTPIVIALLLVKGIITVFLVPIWALLTTHLYHQRVDRHA